jgi:hypothetical protein
MPDPIFEPLEFRNPAADPTSRPARSVALIVALNEVPRSTASRSRRAAISGSKVTVVLMRSILAAFRAMN